MQISSGLNRAKAWFSRVSGGKKPHYKTAPEEVLAEELQFLRSRRPQTDGEDLSGLALSGGGIRSAAFACGVLEALARKGKLGSFDYMSSVSGGGYAASALTWALKARPNAQPDNFPNFPAANGAPFNLVDHIRGRANYLAPTTQITLPIALINVLRLSITSFLIYFTLLVLLAGAFIGAVFYASEVVCDIERTGREIMPLREAARDLLHDMVTLGPSITGMPMSLRWVIEQIILYGDFTCFTGASLMVSVAALGLWLLTVLLYLVAHAVWPPFENTYGQRLFTLRLFGSLTFNCLAATALFALPLLHSIALHHAGTLYAYLVTPAAGAAGGLSHLLALFKPLGERARTLLMRLASALLFLAFAWAVYATAFALVFDSTPNGFHAEWLEFGEIDWRVVGIYAGILVAAAVVCLILNPNYISPHRYYRDRLMEAFMPGRNPGDYAPSDKAGLHEVCGLDWKADGLKNTSYTPVRDTADSRAGLYHLINTNVILVRSRVPKNYQRAGDSFILSPLFCGSLSTGWVYTRVFGVKGWLSSPLSLPTAMAISGAAANPHTSGGDTLTRRWTVSFLMTLLNVRLGYWQPNPRLSEKADKTPEPSFARPGLLSLVSSYYDEEQSYIELSDGGHFDNTGLYELFRRKVRYIVLSDGSCDSDYSLDDLGKVLALAYIDFGVKVHFTGLPLQESEQLWQRLEVIPDQPNPYRGKGDPTDVDACRAKLMTDGFIIGEIDYGDGGKKGTLIYLKPALVRKAPVESVSYGINHPTFPHESTGNQFFTEAQFEAYRRLGCEIATNAPV
jgi:hypothetical protein